MSTEQAIKWHIEKLAELSGVIPQPILDEPEHDPLAVLHFVESLEGLRETENYEELKAVFAKHRIDCGDIRQDNWAWCGILIRAAVVAAGFDDPGDYYNRACNWADIGEEAEPNEPGAIKVYRTHVSIVTEDGGEIGGNVGDEVKRAPAGSNWFGQPIAYRKLV